jgi:hypothetical protein
LLAAVAICAVTGPALAETRQEMVEGLLRNHRPECLIPAVQLSVLQQQDCQTAITIFESIVDTFATAKEKQAADDAARERARNNSAKRPATQVCGPDHWQKDHWEPSCH